MTRARWVAAFLTLTAAAVGMELWASFDSDPNTVPWTDLLVTHVPEPVTGLAIGVLLVWLPRHFWVRYRRRRR